ncbi:MAG: CpXC domain-containing protein, partial [Anaerolineae bacterium]
MTHSVAQSITLTCPACRRPFPAEVWLIVDTAERPDLLARIQDGSLHAIPCPHCRHAGAVDAPLLLYRPGEMPPILFSPAAQTTTEQDQEHARGLLGLLHDRLGSEWQDAWLAQGLSGVPRQLLPAALSNDPEAALRELQDDLQSEIERLQREDPTANERLQAAAREAQEAMSNPFWASLQALLQTDSMASLLHVAQDHPALLTDESAARIAEAAANARRQGAEQAANDLEQRYQLLRNTQRAAQEAGLSPEQTLAATTALEQGLHDSPDLAGVFALGQTIQTFINARTWDDSQQIVEQHPELLSDKADVLFGQLIAATQASQVDGGAAELEEHRDLLRRCREVGIPRAFAEKVLPPEALAEAERLGLAPEEFLAAARAAQDMPPALREVLAELAANGAEIHSAEDLERALASRPDLQAKLEAAAPARGFDVPSELQSILEQLARPARITDMPQRVQLCRQALALLRSEQNAPLWAGLHVKLGNSLAQNPLGDRAENLEQAIAAYRQALEVMTRQAMPVEWATVMMNLATAYSDRIRGDRAENLEQAITAYRQALEVFTPEGLPDYCRRAARSLANLCFAERRYALVVDPYRLAMQATDTLLQASLVRGSKEVELREIQGLPANAAYALAQLGRLPEAIVVLEQGRTRLLAEALEQNRRDLQRLPALGHGGLYERYRAASDRLTALQQ